MVCCLLIHANKNDRTSFGDFPTSTHILLHFRWRSFKVLEVLRGEPGFNHLFSDYVTVKSQTDTLPGQWIKNKKILQADTRMIYNSSRQRWSAFIADILGENLLVT